MRFTVRTGTDPIAGADATLLSAMGLPGGGVLQVGETHTIVRPADLSEITALRLGPETLTNAGVTAGQAIEAKRVMLPTAEVVMIAGDELPLDARTLVHALQGRPVTPGDMLAVDPSYADGDSHPVTLRIATVSPGPAGIVTAATRFVPESSAVPPIPAAPARRARDVAALAGLDEELETLTGWLTLLTSPNDLPTAWGLPKVAGVQLEGPTGCGKSELVGAAAAAAGATVTEVNLNLVFKPDRLLTMLEQAVKLAARPAVLFVDRVEAVAGEEGLAPFRTQVAAILRWFLDAVAERSGVACVLGVTSAATLEDTLAGSALLPRTLTIPPPDLQRRRLMFEAATERIPSKDLDFELLAARSAGFSGADITAAVVHASALATRRGGQLTTDLLLEAVESTVPSLGSVPMGEVPSYGFEKVANLSDVKQRLTESVIWPVTSPDRFERLGIDPPRGVLLYGPPGTGKTFVVRALAHESSAAFFPIKGAELLDKFVGESERGVREVFARARAAAPAILFFDELDALAPVRGRSTTSVTDSVVAALLTEMDGVAERGDVAVIGATNRRDLIDPALLRAGRFEVHVELGLPQVDARRALLGLSDVPFAADVDLDELARRADGLSFADLAGMLREAALTVLREGKSELIVDWPELDGALGRYGRS
ncbi:ATP-dependent zinc metalloprotease FtsH [bacterium BMS3Abin02]|nr:ATP-dependent zinc metalloprotease FtsH [bacterium BMS3Abin02]HDH25322.1 AAA family ATPase [Actinomycetota bacterium]